MSNCAQETGIFEDLLRCTFRYLLVTSPYGRFIPKVLRAYCAGPYAIALWSYEQQSGFAVLQSVLGVWAVLGIEVGCCNVATHKRLIT